MNGRLYRKICTLSLPVRLYLVRYLVTGTLVPSTWLAGSTWYLVCIVCVDHQAPDVEGNLIVNKGELQYYDYSIAVPSTGTSLLALTHVPNLVAAPAWFVRRMYGASYADINTPSPPDSGRRTGTGVEMIAALEAKHA